MKASFHICIVIPHYNTEITPKKRRTSCFKFVISGAHCSYIIPICETHKPIVLYKFGWSLELFSIFNPFPA